MAVHLYNTPVDAVKELLPKRFERKYYILPKDVGLAYGLLRQISPVDSKYPSEQINSLYFDTADLDQHERSASGDFYKDKVRLRWYGTENDMTRMQSLFIELKSRQGFASTKQRLKLPVPAENLALDKLGRGILPRSIMLEALTRFGYFPSEMLQPVIKISYWRYRFREFMSGQQISLDCHIRSTMIISLPGNGERELKWPGGIIEIKGQTMELPISLKETRMLDTDWTRFSKYSACIDSHTEKPGTMGRLSPSGRIISL